MAGNRKQLVRERMRFTGESYRVALEEIRQFGPLPPAGTLWQEWLEYFFVDWLGQAPPDLTSEPGDPLNSAPEWPAGTVMGIQSVTPRPHELLLTVDPAALAGLLASILPSVEDDDQTDAEIVRGVPGLRPRLAPRGLELYWPGSEALIALRKVTEQQWRNARVAVLRSFEDDEARPIWPASPTSWTLTEQRDLLGHDGSRGFPDGTWIDSGIIRRAGLFLEASASVLEPTTWDADGPEHGPRDTLAVETHRPSTHSRLIHVPIDYDHRTEPSVWAIRNSHTAPEDPYLPTLCAITGRPWTRPDDADRN